jgi:hypothetical protein
MTSALEKAGDFPEYGILKECRINTGPQSNLERTCVIAAKGTALGMTTRKCSKFRLDA